MFEPVRISTLTLSHQDALDKVTVGLLRPGMLIALDIYTPVWVMHYPQMKQRLSNNQALYRFSYFKSDVELASLVSLRFIPSTDIPSTESNVSTWYDPAQEFSVLWTPYID